MSKICSPWQDKCLEYQKVLSVPIVNEILEKQNNPYNLSMRSKFLRPVVYSVLPGRESISYLEMK